MRLRFILILAFVSLSFMLKATHNRAGEITYKWLFGNTYEIKITTYTNIGGPNLADRCEDTLHFGDGTKAVVPRSNGGTTLCSAPARDGEPISTTIKLNEYIINHTYPGPGGYKIWMQDPNRNAGVINIPNSVNQVFYVESYLVIPTFSTGRNSSPILSFPPIDKGCVGKCFRHNAGAYDLDGDSLSYELTSCRGTDGVILPGYSFPATGGGTYDIDPITGTLTWCRPQQQGEYNLAFIIKEWRKNFDGEYFLIGYVIRDLQVDVGTCNNNEPVISPISDTCVTAGSFISKIISVTDPDNDVITLSANGAPFGSGNPTANFASVPGFSPVLGTFSWQTSCTHIRKSPYQVTIKAIDNDAQIQLVDFKTFNIRVVAPPPLNLTATPLGVNVRLVWNKPICYQTTNNKIEFYKVYRKANCNTWTPSVCETGVPAYTGYSFIGQTTNLNDTTLLDTNNGNGLSQGTNYSYVVIAVFTDGAESYASAQVCVQLKRDVPILINVDVQTTDATTGSIFVRWIRPFVGFNALDTIAVPGPYEFRLMHLNGFAIGAGNAYTQVYSVTKPNYSSFNQLSDTTFIHSGINTQDNAHTYKVEFYANGVFIGNGQRASSVYLNLTPSDNQLNLTWQTQVPWLNYINYIYKKGPGQTTFSLIDSTSANSYLDAGLVNGATYCYKVQTKGDYSDPTIFKPLLNFSQEICGKPVDLTPPCSPTLSIISDCQIPTLKLVWNNPNNFCSDDAIKYNLYYAETDTAALVIIDSIKVMSDTVIVFDNLFSIAGCYAITAVDSFGNESLQSLKQCVDNCPEYELPNVITVNGDGVNDFFKPIKNKFVKDIDLKIYNRWGNLVHETTDPKIMWNGTISQTKELCSEGTYFYVCVVNEIRLAGIKSRTLKGFVQVFHK